MKRFKLIPVGAALALFVATSAPAFAVTVSPAGPISLTGSTTLGKSGLSLGCAATMTGTITSTGEISITSAKFSGNSLCSLVAPTNLPWTGQVANTTSLSLNNVAVDVKVVGIGGQCGPTALTASITENTAQKETIIGFAHQALSGGCTVSGSLTTTPFLTVH